MKKLLLTVVVVLAAAQMSFGAVTGTKINKAKNDLVKLTEKQIKADGKKETDAELKARISGIFSAITHEGMTLNAEGLQKIVMLDVSTSQGENKAIAEIARLVLTIKDDSMGKETQKLAADALEIMSIAGEGVKLTGSDAQIANLKLITELSDKVATFKSYTSQSAKNWVGEFVKALESGKSVAGAIKLANEKTGKEITEEQIRSCKKA